MVNSNAQSQDAAIVLAHAETDALLQQVTEQIDLDTFDVNDAELLRSLVESLGDTRGMTRLRCAETLAEIGEAATPFLLDALANHVNPVVRRAAGKTLTLIGDPTAVPNLIHALLNDEDTVVKGSSIGALARIGEPSVQALLDILASTDLPESTIGHAAWALAFIGAGAKEYLYRAIASDSPVVRGAVVGAIAKVAQEEPKADLFEILVKSLTDVDVDVRCEAAAALGNLAYKPAIPNLIELLHHSSDGESRRAAALSLMKVGDRSAIEPLQTALAQESEAAVQGVIKLAISQIK
ncbi:MAG: HEAT repeat domain-containing protein [Microcoleus sp. PH2017_15_JOR_U_A]|nr:HEAT repeat domain-containing protein [Microcoleus sp. PH2017_15_JOR_U_A]MCC3507408.1 HEAT repeat domain-containing protein [Microcoleus sp. PH2017_19_SFW_U_A]MCC3524942.1 HEAT repeat domain-containing protein [Microcoleus sp. PH2017_20_SFW_D_A]MCC3555766.1 HEAT repeat domain-containing protein [Microcoleus sp. PH2017_35_SFW_U_B]TAG87965.1 MAG: HEAT repeat domain-containing protein [Oscillatoriales cyanobacterium]